jgi:plasmid stabilization system protein ParE
MMRVVFRKEALSDLQAIVAWYDDVAPQATGRVLTDIFRAIDLVARFPRAGAAVPERPFRRTVSRRYRFRIAYELSSDLIVILGIFRYQDREA